MEQVRCIPRQIYAWSPSSAGVEREPHPFLTFVCDEFPNGVVPAASSGLALVNNRCANAVHWEKDDHVVVLVWTPESIVIFNSQPFDKKLIENGTDGACRITLFKEISLIRDLMLDDQRTGRKWLHVPSDNKDCVAQACRVIRALGRQSVESVMDECVCRARKWARGEGENPGAQRVWTLCR